MHSISFSCSLPFCILLLSCFHVASLSTSAQPSPTTSPDHLADSIEKTWPAIRLVRLDVTLVESLMMVEMEEEIDKLDRAGQMLCPAPVPNLASVAIRAISKGKDTTFKEFRTYICRAYPEYDCEYDFDLDMLHGLYSIAKGIVLEARRAPGPLYLITSLPSSGDLPVINAVLSFDSLIGTFKVISYSYPLQGTTLLELFAKYYQPQPPIPSDELALLPIDSIKQWNALSETMGRSHIAEQYWAHRLEFLWLYQEGEEKKEFGPIVVLLDKAHHMALSQEVEVDSIEASCSIASAIGLGPPELVRTSRLGWNLYFAVKDRELFEKTMRENSRIRLNVQLDLIGEMNAPKHLQRGAGHVAITIIPDGVMAR